MSTRADFLVIGAGVVGLSIARELKQRVPKSRIIVLEKEAGLGRHMSGRNSGVLHSGLYYPESSLKARVCVDGMRAMATYCEERGLPIARLGKVIVPANEGDGPQLELLEHRAKANGARVEIIDSQRLREIEPEAHSVTGKALYSPDTAVIDPHAILDRLASELREAGVELRFGQRFEDVDVKAATARTGDDRIAYGHLFNSAGLQADRVAQAFGIGKKYTAIPFKGLYWKLAPNSGLTVNGLIYPVPDMNVPFLGVHFTKKVDGAIYLGPTAIPALGRENYHGLTGLEPTEIGPMLGRLLSLYTRNKQGFRNYAHAESLRFFRARFAEAARALAPNLRPEHLLPSDKVGIRAQLLDLEKGELVMDFLVEHGDNSTHVLNAVSPAFTSAFSFAKLVLDEIGVA